MRPSVLHAHRTPRAGRDSRLEQRRRQVAGLAILAMVILIFSMWRAGLAAVFPTGWWRFW